MAKSVKNDIRDGSMLQVGIRSVRYDRAVRRMQVSGLPDTNNALKEAIDAVLDQESSGVGGDHIDILTHPSIPTLPLQAARATRWGAKAHVRLDYHRRSFSIPVQPATLLNRKRSFVRAVRWYRQPFNITGEPNFSSQGYPNGDLAFFFQGQGSDDPLFNKDNPPMSWVWRQAGLRVIVPTVLNADPTPNVIGRINKINENTVTWGNYTFPPYTVKFADLSVDAVEVDGGIVYPTQYTFEIVQEGYYTQMAFFDGMWSTVEGLEFEAVSFGDGFPVHG